MEILEYDYRLNFLFLQMHPRFSYGTCSSLNNHNIYYHDSYHLLNSYISSGLVDGGSCLHPPPYLGTNKLWGATSRNSPIIDLPDAGPKKGSKMRLATPILSNGFHVEGILIR